MDLSRNKFQRENLRDVDLNIAEGKMKEWKSEYYYRYSILDITNYYLPEIKPIFTNLTYKNRKYKFKWRRQKNS